MVSKTTPVNTLNVTRLTSNQLSLLNWCIEQASDWRGSLDLDDVEYFDKKIERAKEILEKIKKNNTVITKMHKLASNELTVDRGQ